MTRQRIIIQMGQGVDLTGNDPAAAALRAVQTAMNGAALPVLRGVERVEIMLHIGAPEPSQIDAAPLEQLFADAQVHSDIRIGGLRITDPDTQATQIVVTAAIEVFVPKD